MTIEQTLQQRSNNQCELCASTDALQVYAVPPSDETAEQSILVCGTCYEQLTNPETIEANHWRCLNNSMWSTEPAVQVVAYRLLKQLATSEVWAQDLLAMLYLEPEVQSWADATQAASNAQSSNVKDSNGTPLYAGDSVTIIKDLEVKGAGFTAKRGTTVKNISLGNDPELIEGRVNGVKIYLKTCFLKKL